MMKRAILGFALVLSACQPYNTAPAPDPLYWLSWSGVVWEPAYQAAADEAVSEWNAALGRPVFAFGWRPFVGVTIMQVPHLLEGPGKTVALGLTYSPRGRAPYVVISTTVEKSQYRVIMAHELGHVLGLTHSTDPKDLMFTAPPIDAVVSPEDKRRAMEMLESRMSSK